MVPEVKCSVLTPTHSHLGSILVTLTEAEAQPRSQVEWSVLNTLSSWGFVEAPTQLQVSVIYLVLAGLPHGLLSISVHSCAQTLSHQEVSAQFQSWSIIVDPLGLVHGCPCATCLQSPSFLQAWFFKPFSPFVQQKKSKGGVFYLQLCH